METSIPTLSPADPIRVDMAREFFQLGLYQDAWLELQQVRWGTMAQPEVLELAVNTLLGLGRPDYATTLAERGVQMRPTDPQAYRSLALARAARSLKKAFESTQVCQPGPS